jgi:hypothetical protein
MKSPWEGAVLDSLLAVLPPPVSVLEVVNLALGHEREPRRPRPLRSLLLRWRRLGHSPAHHVGASYYTPALMNLT